GTGTARLGRDAQPDRRDVLHHDRHHAAGRAVLGAHQPGFVARGRRPSHRGELSGNPHVRHQPRRVQQGARHAGSPGCVHSAGAVRSGDPRARHSGAEGGGAVMRPDWRRRLANVHRLGVKELWSLWRDRVMLVLIVYAFTAGVYTSATAMPETLHDAPIAIVDEDRSPLSGRIVSALYPPQFRRPVAIGLPAVDPAMDAGDFTFVLVIPVDFQRKVLAGERVSLQLHVDATRMSQASVGGGYVQQIVMGEVAEFVQRYRGEAAPAVELALRARFNPSLEQSWFGALMEVINNVTMLSI